MVSLEFTYSNRFREENQGNLHRFKQLHQTRSYAPKPFFSFNPDSPQQGFYSSKTLYCMILQPIYKPSLLIRLTASSHDLRLIIPPCHG